MDEELAAFLNQRFEETRRHFDVVAEGLRGEIRVVAEGHLGLGQQLQVLREENESAHREILSAVKFSYAELILKLGSAVWNPAGKTSIYGAWVRAR